VSHFIYYYAECRYAECRGAAVQSICDAEQNVYKIDTWTQCYKTFYNSDKCSY